jgi:hypothetical protein
MKTHMINIRVKVGIRISEMKDESDGSDSIGEFKKTVEQKIVWRELKESVEKKGQFST